MAVNAEAVFVHSVYVMVLTDIYTVSVMVGIGTPHEIVAP